MIRLSSEACAVSDVTRDSGGSWDSSPASSCLAPHELVMPLMVTRQTLLRDVIDLMSRDRQTCQLTCNIVSASTTTYAVQNDSIEHHGAELSCVVIVEDAQPIGIFTERDLVRLAAHGTVIANQTIDTVMTSSKDGLILPHDMATKTCGLSSCRHPKDRVPV